jgi:hypothetical protein
MAPNRNSRAARAYAVLAGGLTAGFGGSAIVHHSTGMAVTACCIFALGLAGVVRELLVAARDFGPAGVVSVVREAGWLLALGAIPLVWWLVWWLVSR